MATGRFGNVVVEPHQKHVTGQSDLETALHTLLDHLREPFMALKGSATEFSHSFNQSLNQSFNVGSHKPKNARGGYARVFAPKIDMRESSYAYYIDVELPGVHEASALTIVWRSDRELLVEGVIERPVISDILGLDAQAHPQNSKTNGFATFTDSASSAPPYVVADEANGFEKNEDLAPQTMWSAQADGPDTANAQRREREQAAPFAPPPPRRSNAAGIDNSQNEDLFPIDLAGGRQLDEGDRHRVQVPMHHLPNGDDVDAAQACVSIGERDVGHFMRCFVFPHVVDVKGMRSEMVDGLLRIGVPKETRIAGDMV
jgi:HSP20 family molecular chaperone IbpA